MEREEEAEKEPAAQEPSLLMQGEEVHEPAIALMVNGTRRRSRKRTRMPLCSSCHARFLATAPTKFLVYLSPVKNHGFWQVRCGNIDYFGPSHKPYTVYCR